MEGKMTPETSDVYNSHIAMKKQLDHEILSKEDEQRLLAAAKQGDRNAEEELVKHNQRLVRKIALHYYCKGFGGDQHLIDLMQWGNIGLLTAIRKWDGRRGKLSTYATYWITQYVRRFALKMGITFSLTYRESERMSEIRRMRSILTTRKNREPTNYEIANEVECSLEDVMFSTDLARGFIRLDGQMFSQGGFREESKYNFIKDPQAVDPDKASEMVSLKAAVACLDEREKDIIVHRFGLDDERIETFQAIGLRYHLSKVRIEQIYANALAKLRWNISLQSVKVRQPAP
jgi:RNA polymerase sigma factor (sigma-70 family)